MPFHLALGLSDGGETVFEPGGLVEGYVTFDLRESVKVKAIRVSLEGLATTKWLMSESSKSSHGRSREVSYSAKTVYLNEEQLVWKPSEGHAKSTVFRGIHVYPFKFPIPMGIPPNFEGDHGHVRYHLKATVERPWKTNRSINRYLNILPKRDLNSIENTSEETSSSKTKKVGFFLFRYGKVQLQIRIPKKGYVPGESIHVEICVENGSSRPVLKAECSLMQQCRFLAYRYGMGDTQNDRNMSRKRDELKIATVIQECHVDRQKAEKFRMKLKIPATCPSFDSTLIHVDYHVHVKLHVKCRIGNTVRAECPVIIGSVPLREEGADPRTPTFTEVASFSAVTHRSMMSVDEKLTPKYVYYPKFGKSRDDEEPPSLSELQLPPIDSLSDDEQDY